MHVSQPTSRMSESLGALIKYADLPQTPPRFTKLF